MKRLDRTIGLVSVIAISLSAMLGSGIFVLPGLAVVKTGPSVWLAFLLAGLCVLPAAVCKAELATAMPASGGTYVYLFRALGPLTGTVSGLGLWMSLLLKSSFALVGFGAYLEAIAPEVPVRPAGLGLLVLVTLLNIAGAGKLGKVQVAVASIAVLGLAALLALGHGHYDARRLVPLFPTGATGFVGAAAFVFVSYAGVTKIAALAEEVKEPDKNLPRGILLTLLIGASLYGLVTFGLATMVPPERLAGSLRPVYELADTVGGRGLGIAASVLAVVTMTSMAAAGMLASSRFPFAMARDNLLPKALTRIDERFKTPVMAILLTSATMGAVIATLDVMKIAKLASAFTILVYVAENVAVLVMRESRVAWYRPSYRAPLYPAMQIAGVVSGLLLVLALGVLPIFGAVAIGGIGVIVYFAYSQGRTEHLGVVGKIGKRGDLSSASQPPLVEIRDPVETEAGVVVALFGNERSPEMLVEVGAALSEESRIHAAHFSEIDEAELDAAQEEDMAVQSLRRRIEAMAEESQADVEFHSILSRDLVRTVHGMTSRVHCRWLVMQWHGRPRRSLTSLSPIGWLVNNVPANLAMFRDAGVRYVRRILVLPAPGPHDALCVRTADHLAERWRATVTLARFVADDRPAIDVAAELDYLMQLRRLCSTPTDERVLRGRDKVNAIAGATAGFDLLVMSAPSLTLQNLLRRSVEDRITAAAACSVLTLRTPRGQTHEALSTRPDSGAERRARLIDFVEPALLGARVDLGGKAALMSFLAERFAAALDIEVRPIHDAFLEREREQNTGVGRGVALPHGTLAGLPRSLVGVFTVAAPIDYDAVDDEPVGVVFATLCPPSERDTHLQLLSDIARLTIKTDVLDHLRAADSDEQIVEAIRRGSRQLDQA